MPNGKGNGQCPHHWDIESPSGYYSKGVCANCGAEAMFSNTGDEILIGLLKLREKHGHAVESYWQNKEIKALKQGKRKKARKIMSKRY